VGRPGDPKSRRYIPVPRAANAACVARGQLYKNVVRLLHSFVHAGLNGNHRCLVLELLGPSIGYVVSNEYNEPGERLEVDTILRITKQLLQALASLHTAGYAQGGKYSTKALIWGANANRKCA
jgi:serine/threonine protein kinase